MPIRTQEVVVGGKSFKLTMIPGKASTALFNRLCRIGLPSVAKAASAMGVNSLASLLTANLNLSGISEGVQLLFERLDSPQQASILKELFEGARVKVDDGKWADLADLHDDLFAGAVDEVYLLAFEALKLNYASFWRALKAAFSASTAKAAETPTE